MKKQYAVYSFIILIFISFPVVGHNIPSLKLQYDYPATDWESETLPIGNGNMGAMVYGGVWADVIQINEHSLWSGGPGKNSAYNGGHTNTTAQVKQNLQNVRIALQEKMIQFTNNHAAFIDSSGKVAASNYPVENATLKAYINGLTGDRTDFGSYQSLSNLNIAHISATGFPDYTCYSRELDIDNALITVKYSLAGVNYVQEYFISHPDKVIVIRLTADKPETLSRNIWLTTPQTSSCIKVENNIITLEGKPADHGTDGLKFAQQVKIIPAGGKTTVSGTAISVEQADEILILSSAATNYRQCMDDSYNYFSTLNPLISVEENITQAASKPYSQLLANHRNDYKSLYGRMSLSFSGAANTDSKTTAQLLTGYKNNTNTPAENLYLEQVYYQYGRYLLISSSRKNGLPANLQGIWAEGLQSPWSADYHTNINLQMNYWPAEQTHLAECHWPVIEYVKSLVPRGRYTAGYYYCKPDGSPVRGWVIHHENNLWGNTAPGNWYEGFYFPAAAAWMCQDIWEYYRFNQDTAFLEEYYPILLDAALFWVDNLWQDSRDETLVANPSYSPEHGPYSLGASCDQAIITELFDMLIKASKVLNKNTSEVNEIIAAKKRLSGPQIGLAGQFMEWKDELQIDITGDDGHRHVNHLFWLHPGSQIIPGKSLQDDLYVEAMKKTLNTRGDREGTGWSKAWKINFWARLKDGNHSHKLLEELLSGSTLPNLFDTHPPFQIDGNFGATAGMTEMLVQSQGEYIELFPALPDAWPSGNFKGIKARGNFEIAARWENRKIVMLEIISHSGKICKLKIGDNTLSFETVPETTYVLNPDIHL